MVVKKVDIVKWDSPVARQFGLRQIPHLLLYDGQGRLVCSGYPSAFEAFLELD